MNKKLKVFIGVVAPINALLMVAITFFLLSLPFTHEDEYTIIEYTSAFKHLLLKIEDKPPKKELLFINVAHAKELIDKMDETGFFPIGNEAITDRGQLAMLFDKLSQNPTYKYIFCDIHFIGNSPSDNQLDSALNQAPRVILSYHYNAKDSIYEYPIYENVERGLADYTQTKKALFNSEGAFLKFNIFQYDSVKTVPLKVYEALHEGALEEDWPFDKLNGQPILTNFILSLRVRQDDLFKNKEKYHVMHLSELLILPPAHLSELVKDRIVMVGDFTDRDVHETVYGQTAGPLLLLNAYYSLKAGDNIIYWHFIVILLLSYIVFSAFALYPQNTIQQRIMARFKISSSIAELAFDFMTYFVLLIIVSITLFFLYNIHLNVFFLAMELYGLSKGAGFLYEKLKWVEEQTPKL